MLKHLLLFVCLTTALATYAQTLVEHPFPTDSAAWYDVYECTNWDTPCGHNDKYYLKGDTFIDNNLYSKVNYINYNNYPNNLIALLRSDSNRVFVRHRNFFGGPFYPEILLYNYNLQVGDSFSLAFDWWAIDFFCCSIDSIITNDGYRKRWNLITDYQCEVVELDTLKWVEGATSNYGLFYDDFLYSCQATDTYANQYTACFIHKNQLIIGNSLGSCEALVTVSVNENNIEQSINIFPNPATGSFTIQLGQNQAFTAQVYNTTGQLMDSFGSSGANLEIPRNNLPPGLYFVRLKTDDGIYTRKLIFE